MEGYQEPHPLLSLISACFSVIFWLLSWIKASIAFLAFQLPRWIYAILSYSFTLTLNFYTLAFLFCVLLVVLSFVIRFQYLSKYKALREVPLPKPGALDLHPDVNKEEEPASFRNYLDEFLQAVRVFGFLEKPVFHELARHLQTRRLIAGDTMSLDADKSFYCVVDGTVQVFAPPSNKYGQMGDGDDIDANWGGEMNGYQLLNEVGNGGTLSSLFTILSLFTEDIQIRWTDDKPQTPTSNADVSPAPSRSRSPSPRRRGFEDADATTPTPLAFPGMKEPTLDTTFSNIGDDGSSGSPRSSISSSQDTIHGIKDGTTVFTPKVKVMSPDDLESDHPRGTWSPPSETSPGTPKYQRSRRSSDYFSQPRANAIRSKAATIPVQQGLIARATTDTTLAVIPAEAFRRLTQKFPKASAHIVQVILTRFSRVTFQAAHKYLGLTSELLRTEKAINEMACHPLPPLFYEGGGIENLRQRFHYAASVNSDSEAEESDYFTQSSDASPSVRADRQQRTRPKRSMTGSTTLSSASTAIATKSSDQTRVPSVDHHARSKRPFTGISKASTSVSNSPITPFKPTSSRTAVNAGDLMTSTGRVSDTFTRHNARSTPSISRRLSGNSSLMREAGRMHTEDFDLREEVMSCIAKSIGLLQPPLAEVDSTLASPTNFEESPGRLGPAAAAAMFNPSFSSLLQGDDATSSMSSGVVSSSPGSANMKGLDNEVEILFFPAGSTIVKAKEKNAGLFYVIDGLLDVSIPIEDNQSNPLARADGGSKAKEKAKERSHSRTSSFMGHNPSYSGNPPKGMKHLFTVKPGGIAGYLASLSGIPSYVDIKAKTDVYVGLLPAHALERLLEKRPIVLLTLAKRLISLLSPLVLQIDSSLDWTQLNSGQVLWRPGDESDSFYIVINGRLRALAEKENGEVSIVKEYGQGDTVGELDVITNQPRKTTLHAIRDTELARMPMTLFNAISARHPQTTVHLLRMIASRVRDEVGGLTKIPPTIGVSNGISDLSGRNNFNLKTVAIIPTHKNVPIYTFGKRLQTALEEMGAPTSFLNQSAVMQHLGKHAFTKIGKLKVAGWLADQEQRYRIVLYVADSPVSSPWTQTCIRQADFIMMVGIGDEPSIGDYERLLMATKTTARKELVLLHPSRSVTPGTTRKWLKERSWVHAHFHVELAGIEVRKPVAPILEDPAAVIAFKKVKDVVLQSELWKYRRSSKALPQPRRPSHMNDFARLARHLCGRSIGLVLGGGGARGLSHVGMIRALEEAEIPIDHIGGTSIGALVGGLFAQEGDIISCAARAKQFSMRMGSFWRLATDLTWPIVAYTTGHEFNRSIYKCFYDSHIEDMWLPYFCNSTNILDSRQEIHDSGYAWRYVRASMSLVGLLPPLSDNGRVLVDGGYVDNLPVAAMQGMGTSTVIAVDVGSIDDNTPRHFGDTVSGTWMLLNRWNPFSSARSVPQIAEIQTRLAYVSCMRNLEEVKVAPNCLYAALPVQQFGTLQFANFDEISGVGYRSAKEMLQRWESEGRLPNAFEEGVERSKRRGRGLRRNSI